MCFYILEIWHFVTFRDISLHISWYFSSCVHFWVTLLCLWILDLSNNIHMYWTKIFSLALKKNNHEPIKKNMRDLLNYNIFVGTKKNNINPHYSLTFSKIAKYALDYIELFYWTIIFSLALKKQTKNINPVKKICVI